MLNPPLLFAALSAGLLGGVHCIGMCGSIANMLSSPARNKQKIIPVVPEPSLSTTKGISFRRIPLLLHTGRIFTYALMGAIVGSIGAAGMQSHPLLPAHTIMYIAGNLALIWLGLRLFGYTPHFAPLDRLVTRITLKLQFSPRFSFIAQSQRYPFLAGMVWGLLPCGLVYGVLPFSLLSGDAWSGAVLMIIFGVSALPHLLFAQGIAHWLRRSNTPTLLRVLGASLLTGIGLLGLWWSFDMNEMPAFLCVTRPH